MLRSSLGFHTLTLSMYVWKDETNQLLTDFTNYSKKKKNIQMYQNKHKNWVVKFYPNDRGIKWEICRDIYLDRSAIWSDLICVTINPKILSRNINYIEAANYHDMNIAITNFNDLSEQM